MQLGLYVEPDRPPPQPCEDCWLYSCVGSGVQTIALRAPTNALENELQDRALIQLMCQRAHPLAQHILPEDLRMHGLWLRESARTRATSAAGPSNTLLARLCPTRASPLPW